MFHVTRFVVHALGGDARRGFLYPHEQTNRWNATQSEEKSQPRYWRAHETLDNNLRLGVLKILTAPGLTTMTRGGQKEMNWDASWGSGLPA